MTDPHDACAECGATDPDDLTVCAGPSVPAWMHCQDCQDRCVDCQWSIAESEGRRRLW